jgi:type IV secretory pathway TraG/TraD family ATPase VirD4
MYPAPRPDPLATVLAMTEATGHSLTIGWSPDGPAYAPSGHGVLVVGPPRSGKTSSVVVPNVLAAAGPVVAASTKGDVLATTAAARSRAGQCLLFDPSGTIAVPPGVEPVAWSPLAASRTWDGAMLMAESMVQAARPGSDRGDAAHWNERATALLAVAMHAGALDGMPFGRVMAAIDRRGADEIRLPLAREDADVALNLFKGITATDSREQSGIWSTASGILSGYRTEAALASTEGVGLDAAGFLDGISTLYVCAGSDRQRQAAPLVAGLVRELRTARYARAVERPGAPPLVLALDELANIAPLHDLPTLVAEGGGQGVVMLACLQDLSQASAKWGREADGFLTLFGTKLVFPGVGDSRTLEALSTLGGDMDVSTRSVTSPRATGWAAIVGRRPGSTRTDSIRRERRLPPDSIARGRPGSILCVDGAEMSWVRAEPWWRCPLLTDAATLGRAVGSRSEPHRERANERPTPRHEPPGRAL